MSYLRSMSLPFNSPSQLLLFGCGCCVLYSMAYSGGGVTGWWLSQEHTLLLQRHGTWSQIRATPPQTQHYSGTDKTSQTLSTSYLTLNTARNVPVAFTNHSGFEDAICACLHISFNLWSKSHKIVFTTTTVPQELSTCACAFWSEVGVSSSQSSNMPVLAEHFAPF